MTKPTHWKTRDGRVMPITEMETEHIRNVVAMLRKVGAVSVSEAALMFAQPPGGDHAYDAWEKELMDLKVSRYLDLLLIELRRREARSLEDAVVAEWTTEHHAAAAREGWFLSTCEGSMYGPLQVQKVDDPDQCAEDLGFPVPELGDDDAAWALVRSGTAPHHIAARDLLRRYNPAELERIMKEQP